MVAAEDGFVCGDPDHAGWTWEQDYAHHSGIAAQVAAWRDHIVPLSRGGSDALENIQPLCTDCNTRKAQRTTDYRPQATRALDGE